MQYEKMPRFLNQTQTSMTKQNMAPVSGSTSIRQQTDMLIETYRDEKPGRDYSNSKVVLIGKTSSEKSNTRINSDLPSIADTSTNHRQTDDENSVQA